MRLLKLLFLFLLFSCNRDASQPRLVHEPAKPPAELLKEDITPGIENSLSETVLDLKNWREKKISATQEFQSKVHAWNNDLLKNGTPEQWSAYEKIVLSGCDDLLRSCENVGILRTSPLSVAVLQKMASQKSDAESYYKLLLMALDIQNKTFTPSLLNDLAKRSKEYRQILKTKNQDARLEAFDRVLKLIVAEMESGRIVISDKSWIEDLDFFSSSNEDDVVLAARLFMYKDSKTTELTDGFKKTISTAFGKPTSLVQKYNEIEKVSGHLIPALELKKPEENEYLFLLDQILSDKFPSRLASRVYEVTRKNQRALLEAADGALKIQLAYVLHLSQQDMQDFLKKTTQFTPSEYFPEAQKSLSRSLSASRGVRQRAETVQNFLQLALGSSGDPELRQLLDKISGLDKTQKVLIAYPQFVAVVFKLLSEGTDMQTELKIPVSLGYWFPRFRILLYFLHQNDNYLLPFAYGNDTDPLTYFEALESIAMGLKTKTLNVEGATLDKFLTEMFDSALTMEMPGQVTTDGSRGNMLTKRIQNLEMKYSGPEWPQFLMMCEALKHKKSFPRSLSIQELKAGPTLGETFDLLNNDFVGTNTRTSTSAKATIYARGYYVFSHVLVDQLEWIRLDLLPLLRHYQILREISAAQGLETPLLSERMEAVKTKIKYFLNLLNTRRKEFFPCFYDVMAYEREMMAKVLSYEMSFWKAIHREMKLMRQDPAYVSPLNKSPLAYTLPNGVIWRSRISGDATVAYNFDEFLRIKNYVEKGGLGVNLPALDGVVQIQLPPDMAKDDFYEKSGYRRLDFVESETDFVNQAMRSSGFGDKNVRFFWFQSYALSILNFRQTYDAYALLLKLNTQVQEVLGMAPLITMDEFVQMPLEVNRFMKLTANEPAGLKAIGLPGRWRAYDIKGVGMFQDKMGQMFGTHAYLLKSMMKKYMGPYGNEEIYENPMQGSVMPRPKELVPVLVLAENLYVHRKHSEAKLFNFEKHFAQFIDVKIKDYVRKDFQVTKDLQKSIENLEKQVNPADLSLELEIGQIQPMRITGPKMLEEVDAFIQEFKNKTGSFFELP